MEAIFRWRTSLLKSSNQMWYVGSCYSFCATCCSLGVMPREFWVLNIIRSPDLYYTNRFSVCAGKAAIQFSHLINCSVRESPETMKMKAGISSFSFSQLRAGPHVKEHGTHHILSPRPRALRVCCPANKTAEMKVFTSPFRKIRAADLLSMK